MRVLGRRFLVLQAFLLWQGGFLFYAAVVVPVGTDELGSAFAQGRITARVTGWLNLFGGVYVLLAAWDVYAGRGPRVRWRAGLLAGCAAGLAALAFLRSAMLGWMGPSGVELPGAFRAAHIAYLWVSTAHWLAGLALAARTLAAWRAEDRRPI